jgi:hypothetical protein
MRRSLFSSVLAVVLMAASCGGDGAEKQPGSEQEAEAATSQPVSAPLKSGDAQPQHNEEGEASERSEEFEVAPVHGTPDPEKSDSIKNSYPKKK